MSFIQNKTKPTNIRNCTKLWFFSFGHCVNSEINFCRLLLLAGVMWVGEICAIFCMVLSGILSARMTAENDSFQQHSLAHLVTTWLMTVNFEIMTAPVRIFLLCLSVVSQGLGSAAAGHPSDRGDSHGHPAAHQFAPQSHMSYWGLVSSSGLFSP